MQLLTSLIFASTITRTLAGPQWRRSTHGPDVLQPGTPQSVGMLARPLWEMERNISNYEKPANYEAFSYNEVHPIEPGESVIGLLPLF